MTVSVNHEPIWLPDPDEVTAANVSRFARWLTEHGRTWFAAYQTRTSIR